MMTLKLDMKHICKKDVRRKGGGEVFGLGWGLWEVGARGGALQRRRGGGGQGAQSFSEEGIQM